MIRYRISGKHISRGHFYYTATREELLSEFGTTEEELEADNLSLEEHIEDSDPETKFIISEL